VKFLVALVTVVMLIHPAQAVDEAVKKSDVEHRSCVDACTESYEGSKYSKAGMPLWFYRSACMPRCLDGMTCNEINNGEQWECVYKEL
jgi:hypothetical protein